MKVGVRGVFGTIAAFMLLVDQQASAAVSGQKCVWAQSATSVDRNPLYLLPNSWNDVLQPSGPGKQFAISDGTKIIVACPGSSFVSTGRARNVDLDGGNSFYARCNRGALFTNIQQGDVLNSFGGWKCQTTLRFDVESQRFDENIVAYSVGFDVRVLGPDEAAMAPFRFILYKSFYEESSKSALFTVHKWIRGFPTTGRSNAWYSAEDDVEQLRDYYSRSGWNRGHLVPNADFNIKILRDLTFCYQNAAPQRSRSNSVEWSAVERVIQNAFDYATIITGTSDGIDPMGNTLPAPTFLKNNQVRIPDFFWKIVIPTDGVQRGFVYLNNKNNARNPNLLNLFMRNRRYECPDQWAGNFCFFGPKDVEMLYAYLPEAQKSRIAVQLNPPITPPHT